MYSILLKFAATAIIFGLCLSCSSTTLGPISTIDPERVLRLTRQFDQIAFGREYAPAVEKLQRWNSEVSITLMGRESKKWSTQISEQIDLLNQLTDIPIILALHPRQHQIYVLVDRRTVINRQLFGIFPQFSPPANFINQQCKSIALTGEQGQIKQAYVFVSSNQPDHEIRACIIEELAQSMGLFNDIDGHHETVFDDENFITELTLHDRIMMSTLYDNRLQTGMPREKALPIAAVIIAELLASASF